MPMKVQVQVASNSSTQAAAVSHLPPPPAWGTSLQLDFMIKAMNPDTGTGVNRNTSVLHQNVGEQPAPLLSWETTPELDLKVVLLKTAATNNESKWMSQKASFAAASAVVAQMDKAYETAIEAADLTRAGAAKNLGLQIAVGTVQGGAALASAAAEAKGAPNGAERTAFGNRNASLAEVQTAQNNLEATGTSVAAARGELDTARQPGNADANASSVSAAEAKLAKVTELTDTRDTAQVKHQKNSEKYQELVAQREAKAPWLGVGKSVLKSMSELAGMGGHFGTYLQAEAQADASKATAEAEVHKGLQNFASTVKSNADSAVASAEEKIKGTDETLKEFLSSQAAVARTVWG